MVCLSRKNLKMSSEVPTSEWMVGHMPTHKESMLIMVGKSIERNGGVAG
jgi:hypothetical protein